MATVGLEITERKSRSFFWDVKGSDMVVALVVTCGDLKNERITGTKLLIFFLNIAILFSSLVLTHNQIIVKRVFLIRNPKVDSWLLMRSPVPVLLIMALYFLIIAVGPRLMKNRAPFKLEKVLLYYNGIQVFVASALAIGIVAHGVFKNGFLLGGCHIPMNSKDELLLIGTWIYFIAKVTELLDTVFFVLRKKNNQITLLHVYHHSTMVLYMWSFLKFAPGGDGAVLAFLNCIVHVVMYTYYLLAGMGPKLQKYLWWKKYVTELQLVQFILMLIYLTHIHFSPKCNFSAFFNGFIFTNISIYMILFLDFYYKNYKKNQVKEKA